MNYRNTRNYENLEKRIYDGVGAYDIPVIEPVQVVGECEYIPFSSAAGCKRRENKHVRCSNY